MKHGALIHQQKDDVAVLIFDVAAGTKIQVVTLDGKQTGAVTAVIDIPLGHKIAMRDIAKGKEVIKYGRAIGRASMNSIMAWPAFFFDLSPLHADVIISKPGFSIYLKRSQYTFYRNWEYLPGVSLGVISVASGRASSRRKNLQSC